KDLAAHPTTRSARLGSFGRCERNPDRERTRDRGGRPGGGLLPRLAREVICGEAPLLPSLRVPIASGSSDHREHALDVPVPECRACCRVRCWTHVLNMRALPEVEEDP